MYFRGFFIHSEKNPDVIFYCKLFHTMNEEAVNGLGMFNIRDGIPCAWIHEVFRENNEGCPLFLCLGNIFLGRFQIFGYVRQRGALSKCNCIWHKNPLSMGVCRLLQTAVLYVLFAIVADAEGKSSTVQDYLK